MLKIPAALILVLSAAPIPIPAQSATTASQTPAEGPYPEYRLSSDPKLPIEFPEGPWAWVLEIDITGGLAGKTKSHTILSSEGSVLIDDSDKGFRTKVSGGFPELDKLCQSVESGAFKATPPITVSFCADCYKTRLTIYRLEGAATIEYSVIWDDTTQAKVIEPLLNICRVATQIAQAASKTGRS